MRDPSVPRPQFNQERLEVGELEVGRESMAAGRLDVLESNRAEKGASEPSADTSGEKGRVRDGLVVARATGKHVPATKEDAVDGSQLAHDRQESISAVLLVVVVAALLSRSRSREPKEVSTLDRN